MEPLKLSADAQELAVQNVKRYFRDELDQEIGGFEASFLIDFLSAELGPQFYNQGLRDAHKLFADKADELGYLVQELERSKDG